MFRRIICFYSFLSIDKNKTNLLSIEEHKKRFLFFHTIHLLVLFVDMIKQKYSNKYLIGLCLGKFFIFIFSHNNKDGWV